MGLCAVAVFLVVTFITGSLPVTCLVISAVLLVDIFLMALIHYWDMTLNSIVLIHLVMGLGLSVDFSAHIAHTYLVVEVPSSITKLSEKRTYKAKVAISSMGSSVIHGGMSTLLAVLCTSGAKHYIFQVFFKMWFGIVIFGLSAGFILLPTILSLVGPVPDTNHKKDERRKSVTRRRSTLKPHQLAAILKQAEMDEQTGGNDVEMANDADNSHNPFKVVPHDGSTNTDRPAPFVPNDDENSAAPEIAELQKVQKQE